MGQGLGHDGIHIRKTDVQKRMFASLLSDADISNIT
jgi:hypothetical protein